jgi:hypothetical protein
MRIVSTSLFALALSATVGTEMAWAEDCADFSQLSTGQFNGATLNFPSHGALDLVPGTLVDQNGMPGTFGAVLVAPNAQCMNSNVSTGIELRAASLRGILSDPSITTVRFEFCQFATSGNLSGSLFATPTFVADLTTVSGLQLPGPFGSTVNADSGTSMSGTPDLKIAGNAVSQFVFGGPEVFITQICVD